MQARPASIVMHRDILASVCEHLNDVKQLAMLCNTSKLFQNYLASPAGKEHWLRIAKEACGEKYWIDVKSTQPRGDDGKYVSMIRLCPWLGTRFTMNMMKEGDTVWAPRRMHLDPLNDQAMVIQMQSAFVMDDELLLLDDKKFMSSSARPGQSTYFMGLPGDTTLPQQLSPSIHNTKEEKQLARSVKNGIILPDKIFNTEDDFKVSTIHNKLAAVIIEDKLYRKTPLQRQVSVLFFSTTNRKILHKVNFQCDSVPDVYFGIGEWWIISAKSGINYVGPSSTEHKHEGWEKDTFPPIPTNSKNRSALWMAATGNPQNAVSIIKKEPWEKFSKFSNLSLIRHAMMSESVECLEQILSCGYYLDTSQQHTKNVIFFAAIHGLHSMLTHFHGKRMWMNPTLKFKSEQDGKTDDSTETLLYHMIQRSNITGYQGTIDLLLGLNVNVNVRNSDGRTPLFAAGGLDLIVMQKLCEAGVDTNAVDIHGETALHHFIDHQSINPEAITLLHRFGCNIDFCSQRGETELSDALFKHNQTPLMRAISYPTNITADYAETLIKLGADISVKNAEGETLLEMFNAGCNDELDAEKADKIRAMLNGVQ